MPENIRSRSFCAGVRESLVSVISPRVIECRRPLRLSWSIKEEASADVRDLKSY